jgi:hypothetical protein
VFPAQPLPQHERVLRPDRDDERQAEAETGECGEKRSGHTLTVGRLPASVHLRILAVH